MSDIGKLRWINARILFLRLLWAIAPLAILLRVMLAITWVPELRRRALRAQLLERAQAELRILGSSAQEYWRGTKKQPRISDIAPRDASGQVHPEDPWGIPYWIESPTPGVIWIVSAGPDGVCGTGDDLERETRATAK